jgi:hypothetical protein
MLTACSDGLMVYECTNTSVEFDFDAFDPREPRWEDGRGTVFIQVQPGWAWQLGGALSTVNYDKRYSFGGELEMDHELYIAEEFGTGNRYPETLNKLSIDRYSGEGYFQRLTYNDADTIPDTITERLESCEISEKRF